MFQRIAIILEDLGYKVTNSSQNIQKGLSCGYICAHILSKLCTEIQSQNMEWLYVDVLDCAFPDIALFNQILEISGNTAEELTSEQIMRLVSTLTGDQNIGWIFTVDINLFKRMSRNDFNDLKLPVLNDRRWAIFCVNDALLNNNERNKSILMDESNGNHWFTVAVWL